MLSSFPTYIYSYIPPSFHTYVHFYFHLYVRCDTWMHASTRVLAHHVCCVHTLTHANCCIHAYTHLHACMYLLCWPTFVPVLCHRFSSSRCTHTSSSSTVQWGCFMQTSSPPCAWLSPSSIMQFRCSLRGFPPPYCTLFFVKHCACARYFWSLSKTTSAILFFSLYFSIQWSGKTKICTDACRRTRTRIVKAVLHWWF
jgi:hypothetical protein